MSFSSKPASVIFLSAELNTFLMSNVMIEKYPLSASNQRSPLIAFYAVAITISIFCRKCLPERDMAMQLWNCVA